MPIIEVSVNHSPAVNDNTKPEVSLDKTVEEHVHDCIYDASLQHLNTGGNLQSENMLYWPREELRADFPVNILITMKDTPEHQKVREAIGSSLKEDIVLRLQELNVISNANEVKLAIRLDDIVSRFG